jgi:hypothetical protein
LKKLRWLRIIGATLALIGAVGIGFGLALEAAMIVALGIHFASFLTIAAYIAAGLGGTSFILSFVPGVRKRLLENRNSKLLQAKINDDKEQTIDYEADSLNPEKVRIRLEQLKDRNSNLEDLMSRCIIQKDEIDRYQEQLSRLIRANRALYLNDIPAVLDSTEERMCANFRDIINCCILVEYNGKTISERNQEIVEGALRSNDDELETVETLLDRSVAYINDYNRKGINDRRELDAWIKIMEEKINKKGELSFD